MADRTLTVDIVTPDRVVLTDEATALVAPGVWGSYGILYNHAPLLSALTIGELRYRRDGGEEIRLAIGGGFLQVFDNQITVLADTAELAKEINVDEARNSRDRARHELSLVEGGTAAEREAAQLAYDRARNRVRVVTGE